MTDEELKKPPQGTKDTVARQILQEWINKQGHDRCWYYPELFRKLCVLYDVHPKVYAKLPTREEFENGCKRYQDEQYGIRMDSNGQS